MSTSNITIRLDSALKKRSEELFSDLGLSMTTAITAFIRQSVREQAIPFKLTRADSEISNKTTLLASNK